MYKMGAKQQQAAIENIVKTIFFKQRENRTRVIGSHISIFHKRCKEGLFKVIGIINLPSTVCVYIKAEISTN
jgi:hypothetical protein